MLSAGVRQVNAHGQRGVASLIAVTTALRSPRRARLARRWPAAQVLALIVACSALRALLPSEDAASWPAWQAAALPLAWLAGLALAILAARTSVDQPGARRIAVGAVAGATGATLPSFVAVIRAALAARPDGPPALALRIAPLLADPNAAGSCFAMFAAFAGALWLASRDARRWGLPTAALSAAVWLTGSRTALAAAIGVLATVAVVVRRPARGTGMAIGVGAALLVAGLTFGPPLHTPQASAAYAARVRWDMGRVALEVARAHPLAGVGLGRFQQASRPFIPPAVAAYFPPAAAGENAHDNFLQVLAELGLPGLAAFVWFSVGPVVRAWREIGTRRAEAETVASVAGATTFLVTCLAGHPLLSPVVCVTFFFVIGMVRGTSGLHRPPPAPGARAESDERQFPSG